MWTDARGSEVLERPECLRLLYLYPDDGGDGPSPGGRGSGKGDGVRVRRVPRVGRVGFSLDGVPVILPVNYGMVGEDVVVRTGEGVKLTQAVDHAVVAFEVDAVDLEDMVAWSVLVRGLCTELTEPEEVARANEATPHPLVAAPGDRYLRIRTGVLSGRRFALSPDLGRPAPDPGVPA